MKLRPKYCRSWNREARLDRGTAQRPGDAEWQALLRLTGPAPSLGGGALDWAWLLDLAARHKVVLLLQRGLGRLGTGAVPGEAAACLAALSRQRGMAALAQARESVLMSEAMQDAGIPAAVIKGAALSQQIHAAPGLRDPGDIDLFVPADRMPEAADLIQSRGYVSAHAGLLSAAHKRRRLLACTNQLSFVHPGTLTQIELHWRWQKVDGMMPTDPERVWGAVRVPIGGREVPVPDPVEQFVYLCAHGAGHGWHRLKWLNDIRWVLKDPRCIGGDWSAVAARARQLRMQTSVAAAVLLTARVDGVPPPRALSSLLAETPRAEALSHLVESWMARDAPLRADVMRRRPLDVAGNLMRHMRVSVADQPGAIWTKLAFLARPSVPDLSAVDLPPGLGGGYVVVRLLRGIKHALVEPRQRPLR